MTNSAGVSRRGWLVWGCMNTETHPRLRTTLPAALGVSLAFATVLLFVSPALRGMSHPGYLGALEVRGLLECAFAGFLFAALVSLVPSTTVARVVVAAALSLTLTLAIVAAWRSARIRDVLAALFVVATATSIGSLVLRLLRQGSELSALERFSLATAVGLGVLSHFTLFLSVSGILYAPVAVTIMGAVVVGGARIALRQCQPFGSFSKPLLLSPLRYELLFPVAVLVVLLTCFIQGLAPPVQYDDLNYHLLIPLRHTQAHRYVLLPDVVQSYYYQGTEMLSTLGFLLGGESSAILLNLAAGALTGAGLAGLCGRLFSRRAGWLAVVFWMGTPFALWLTTNAYVEMDLALFCLFSFVLTLSFLRGRHSPSAFLAGLLGAFAMSTRITGTVFAVLVVLAAMAGLLYARQVRDCLRLGAWWVAGFLLVGWPWPLLRLLQTGNPVYPFLHGAFTAQGVNWYIVPFNPSGWGMGRGLSAFLKAPWNLSVHGERFAEAIHPSVIGPALLLAIVLAWFAARSVPCETRYALAVSGLFFCFWFLTGQFSRFLMPTMPLIVFVCAAGFARAIVGFRATTQAAISLGMSFLVLSSFLVIWLASYYNIPGRVPVRVVFGNESRTQYLHRALPVSAAFDSIRQVCGSQQERVFGVANQFGYLCPSLIPWTSPRAGFMWTKGPDQYYREELRRLGVTHVLVDGSAGGARGAPMVDSGFLGRAGDEVYSAPPFKVIRLR